MYVDAPTAFSTAAVALSDTLTSPVYLSTMHWWSGACDDVLGPDGSPSNCTSGKEPFILSGVEFGHGGFTVLADIIMSGVYDADTDTYTQTPYIVHDSRKIANNKITDDYAKCSMTLRIPMTAGSISPKRDMTRRHPGCRFRLRRKDLPVQDLPMEFIPEPETPA